MLERARERKLGFLTLWEVGGDHHCVTQTTALEGRELLVSLSRRETNVI